MRYNDEKKNQHPRQIETTNKIKNQSYFYVHREGTWICSLLNYSSMVCIGTMNLRLTMPLLKPGEGYLNILVSFSLDDYKLFSKWLQTEMFTYLKRINIRISTNMI